MWTGTLLDFDRAEAAAFTKVLQKYGFVPEERFIQEYQKNQSGMLGSI